MNKRFLAKCCLVFFFQFVIFVSGCGESSGPVVSSFPSGNGYKIVVAANPTTISSGGQAAIVASIVDPQGNPVGDEDRAVQFSASAANSDFTTTSDYVGDIKGGTTQVTYTWNDNSDDDSPDASKICIITASYRGAISTIEILLISKSY
ncbi:MAG: hypothetical protein KKB51_08800 [Candidatus Riflebacteria bacterium]|nr:hypothetical protein [Candidatus Riflebacteria bacterium]